MPAEQAKKQKQTTTTKRVRYNNHTLLKSRVKREIKEQNIPNKDKSKIQHLDL